MAREAADRLERFVGRLVAARFFICLFNIFQMFVVMYRYNILKYKKYKNKEKNKNGKRQKRKKKEAMSSRFSGPAHFSLLFGECSVPLAEREI